MPLTENEIQKGLLSFYRSAFPSRKETPVTNVTRITDGWETEVYSFTIACEGRTGSPCGHLILRIYPGNGAAQKADKEFNVMKRLHAAGVPVPEVLHLSLDESFFGQPFVIMEKIDGRSLWQVMLESPDTQKELTTLFCRLFVNLHHVDWRPHVPDPSRYETGDAYTCIDRHLSGKRSAIDYFGKRELFPVLDWLEARRADVPCHQLSITHGDFHPNNILMTDAGEVFIIDWPNAEIDDPRIDLGWTLMLADAHASHEIRDLILDEYERIADKRIDRIEYFEVLAILRRLLDVSVSLGRGATQQGMRPGAENLMRQHADAFRRVHARLCDLTDIAIPEIARLIKGLS